MYDNSVRPYRVTQVGAAWDQWAFNATRTRLGGRKLADVTSPSNKVLLMDEFDRHFSGKRTLYFGMVNARQPILAFDGGVNVRFTRDCNTGGDPNAANGGGAPVAITYTNAAKPWLPNPQNPAGDLVMTYYRFTKGGLRGIDFGGTEVRTGAY
jgi:hypothetical protein